MNRPTDSKKSVQNFRDTSKRKMTKMRDDVRRLWMCGNPHGLQVWEINKLQDIEQELTSLLKEHDRVTTERVDRL